MMSTPKLQNLITNSKEVDQFLVQKPSPDIRIAYMDKVSSNIKNVFSNDFYKEITNSPLFDEMIFTLDDGIQRAGDPYQYIKKFANPIKNMANIGSIFKEVGFEKINQEYIQKLYQECLKSYKSIGLQSKTKQENLGSDGVYLGADMRRTLLDKPIENRTKSLILQIMLYAAMFDECNSIKKPRRKKKMELVTLE